MTQPTPAREVVVVGLGDSTTAGTPGFKSAVEAPPDGEGNRESQYAYWLMRRHPGWRVLNCGVNGERSDQIAARFGRDVLAHEPRVVVVIAGVNDVYQNLESAHVINHLRDIYQRAARASIRVVAGSIVPYNTATADQNRRMHEVNSWISSEATRDQLVVFVDTRAAVAAPDDADRLHGSPDGLHPDVDGYRRMAEALAPAIERQLK